MSGKHVTVQGLGHVGYHLCKYLHSDGARLTVTDIDEGRVARVVREFGAKAVGERDIFAVDADIFAPCALGGIINDDTLNHLQVDIVAGAANNQLSEARHGQVMHERDVVYAPDYVINAGGLCSVYGELHGWTAERTEKKAGAIYDTLLGIFERAAKDGISTSDAADRVARQRIMRARGLE